MKIHFSKYDWSSSCYKPTYNWYYNKKMLSLSAYKYGVTFDFR